MQAKQTWFGHQAFGKEADGLVTVSYKSHEEALLFLQSALNERNGVGLLKGSKGSGKSTVGQRLADVLPGGTAVALVDGTHIKPQELLYEMLAQYGYDTGLQSDNELEKVVKMFAVQQTKSSEPPVLIVDNIDRMYPSALRTLNTLAELQADDRYALRIIATGGDCLQELVESEGMPAMSMRTVGSYQLRPMTVKETLIYLHARLEACGVNNADTVFPVDVSDRLYQHSKGWPGPLNQAAIETIGRATSFPVTVTDTMVLDEVKLEPPPDDLPVLGAKEATGPLPPSLIVTKDGRVVSEYVIKHKKSLIGRSDFADVVIDDQFVSKMHAVLLMYSDAMVLVDLNSSNCTMVNSVRITTTILKSDDIISLGDHRLKVSNAPAISDEMASLIGSHDTIKMKNLIDVRRERAKRLKLVTGEQRG